MRRAKWELAPGMAANLCTREDCKFQSLFEQAGLQIVRTEMQKGIPAKSPRKLLPVKSYALKPKTRKLSLS